MWYYNLELMATSLRADTTPPRPSLGSAMHMYESLAAISRPSFSTEISGDLPSAC